MLDQDFVLTARAKGLTERAVLWRHVLRNGLIPVITVIGYNFGYSLTGAILAETVFAGRVLARFSSPRSPTVTTLCSRGSSCLRR